MVDVSESSSTLVTPSKKKHNTDTHLKSPSDISSDKSPFSGSRKPENSKSNSSVHSDVKHRSHGATPVKSTTPNKSVSKKEVSEDEDEAFERLRAKETKESAKSPLSVVSSAMDVSEDDDDAPVAKSFKSAKKEAIDAHHEEQEASRQILQKEKEKRRQRTQLLQEQSKSSVSKKKSLEKKKREAEESMTQDNDDDEEIELLPESVLKHALSQTQTAAIITKDSESRARIEKKKQKLEEAKLQQSLKINNKLVTVVPLSDGTGNIQMHSRKIAKQSAEHFLQNHLWGGRLERMRSDLYLSERTRGPALQFIVPDQSATSFASNNNNNSTSLKHKRIAGQQKKRDKQRN